MSAQNSVHAINSDFCGGAEKASEIWAMLARSISAVYDIARANPVAGDEMAMQIELRQSVHQMYNQLVDDEDFRSLFSTCPDPADYQSASWSRDLYQDEKIHVALLSIYRGYDIPLHDHPGSYGLALTLSGIARISYANLLEQTGPQGLATLQMDRSAERLPGQVCWFYQEQRNLHRIEAATASTQLLVFHLPPVRHEQQALYFPIEEREYRTGESLLARRIKIKRDIRNS